MGQFPSSNANQYSRRDGEPKQPSLSDCEPLSPDPLSGAVWGMWIEKVWRENGRKAGVTSTLWATCGGRNGEQSTNVERESGGSATSAIFVSSYKRCRATPSPVSKEGHSSPQSCLDVPEWTLLPATHLIICSLPPFAALHPMGRSGTARRQLNESCLGGQHYNMIVPLVCTLVPTGYLDCLGTQCIHCTVPTGRTHHLPGAKMQPHRAVCEQIDRGTKT